MKQRVSGAEQFEQYYSTLFGERWSAITAAFKTHYNPILRFSPKDKEAVRALFTEHNLTFTSLSWYPHALVWPSEIPFGSPVPGVAEGLLYVMNPSSLLPPLALSRALQVIETPSILDACAAPGGKTLVLADLVPNATITANEPSVDRAKRLRNTLRDYHHEDIRILKKSAETLFKEYPEHWDAILVDAPCSSEAHVYTNAHYLGEWAKGRVTQMQFKQLALLGGLILALKPGGILVYSTCSLTPEENEIAIQKLLKKRGDTVELLNAADFLPHIGSHGLPCAVDADVLAKVTRIMPDTESMDPMFVAVLRKK